MESEPSDGDVGHCSIALTLPFKEPGDGEIFVDLAEGVLLWPAGTSSAVLQLEGAGNAFACAGLENCLRATGL